MNGLQTFLETYQSQFYLGLKILLILVLTHIFAKLFDRFIENKFMKVSKRMEVKKTSSVLLKKLIKAGIYIVGISLAVYTVPSLRQISITLFASAGFIGIVVGFAAQQTLSNIVAGIFIAGFEPFRVGDNLTTREHYGTVEDITLRHTVIVKPDNDRVIIPNSMIVDDYIINHSIKNEVSRFEIKVGISYRDDIDRARELIQDELKENEKAMEGKSSILVSDLSDSAVVLKVFIWGKNRGDAWTAAQELRESIKKRFDREGIIIPYPQRTVYIEEDRKPEGPRGNQET